MTSIQALFAKQSRQAPTTASAISSRPTESIHSNRTLSAQHIRTASSKYIMTSNPDPATFSRPTQRSQLPRTRTVAFDPARTALNNQSEEINRSQRIIPAREKENIVPQQPGLLNRPNQLTMRNQNQPSVMKVAPTSWFSDNDAYAYDIHEQPTQYEIQFEAGTIHRFVSRHLF